MEIEETIVAVGDIDAAVLFYVEACGFRHIRTVQRASGSVAELEAGGRRVTLVPGGPGCTLALRSDDVGADADRLRQAGARVGEARDVDGARYAPVTDPWGNALGLWRAP